METSGLCGGCAPLDHAVIQKYWRKEKKSVKFLRKHGVLPSKVLCKSCKTPCFFREDKHIWNPAHEAGDTRPIRIRVPIPTVEGEPTDDEDVEFDFS